MMATSKKRTNLPSFQDWLESLHFFNQENTPIEAGELEPPEDEEDDMPGSLGQELADMSDDEFIEWYMQYKKSKSDK